jgi:coenzyme F420-reducing hydrogenase gamma subunit
MKLKSPFKVACVRFTSCSGCQLMLINCEYALAGLSEIVEFTNFPLVSSATEKNAQIDIALIEGSLSTPAEVEQLLALRRAARLLVAVGACALTGGVNTLIRGERSKAVNSVYGQCSVNWDTFPPQPVSNFVKVDGEIYGCPPERHELLESLGALLHGGWPGRQVMPVCMECRINENRCLLEEDSLPCLGPVTNAGCSARCPGFGIPCEGCRGEVAEANRDELSRLLIDVGVSTPEIRHRLERFGGVSYDPTDR